MPVNAAMAGDPAPRPIIRAQAPEVPTRTASPLMLPTPEALGLAGARITLPQPAHEVDWNDVRARLRRLNAVAFHLDQIAGGQWRASLLVPQAGQQARHIEASAASDAAAVASVLQKAEAVVERR